VRAIFVSAVVLVLAAVTARETSAQTQGQPPQDPNAPVRVLTQRPYRGVYGGGVGQTSQLLTLGLSMGAGFDSSVFVDDRQDPNAVTPVRREQSGFVHGSANLHYSLNLGGVSFSTGGGVSGAYYPKLDEPVARRYFADGGGSWRISTRASLSGQYSFHYRPVQHLSSLPGPGGLDPAIGPVNPFESTVGGLSETYRSGMAGVDFNYQISRRVSTSVRYGNWRTYSPDGDRDQSTNGLSARVTVGLTKAVGVFGGYRLNSGQYSTDDTLPRYYTHGADFGLDFAKALSLTRKTTATFGAGMSGVNDGSHTQYSLTGHASLMREIARTWRGTLTYNRNVGFDQGFRQPVFSDSLTSDVSGLINRRLRADAGFSLSLGRIGFSSASVNADNGYRASYASTGLGFFISRTLSGGVRYGYARYRFGNAVDVPPDLLQQTNRHAVNVYLSSWIPLMTRTRRP
jgi:hypothetical protein